MSGLFAKQFGLTKQTAEVMDEILQNKHRSNVSATKTSDISKISKSGVTITLARMKRLVSRNKDGEISRTWR